MLSAVRQQSNTSFSNITPQTAKEKSDAFIGFLSSAATKVAQLDDGDKVLGLDMIPDRVPIGHGEWQRSMRRHPPKTIPLYK